MDQTTLSVVIGIFLSWGVGSLLAKFGGGFRSVREWCEKAGLKEAPGTVEHPLGVWDKTDLLPENQIPEISTMCGHGMVSFNLVREGTDDVRRGWITAEKAAERWVELCVCGIFNAVRATRLLRWVAYGEDLAGRWLI